MSWQNDDPLRTRQLRSLSRSVVINQLLFTAGHSLTSGGFLAYFAADSGRRHGQE
ncbi:MAG: hypothetical protein R3C12_11960 [Planctomycetaceae bacterium]